MFVFRDGVTYSESMVKKKMPKEIRDYFVRMGRIGGKKGGMSRANALTPEQRSEAARKAVLARWAKVKSET
jgi:hypothetical protein